MPYSLQQLREAAERVYRHMPPTPQYRWPLLCERSDAQVWVKHENHTPTGAFKVRGGILYLERLMSGQRPRGLVSATRGNHGQSLARAAAAHAVPLSIVVPRGNSQEKNAAMRALGARLIEHGEDFDEARAEAARLAEAEGLLRVPAYHPDLVLGVASYALEFFTAVPDLHTVYVPVGCGSGLCAVIAARDALGLKTRVVGVVAAAADAAKRSFDSGRLQSTATAATLADGLAVREPVAEAFEHYRLGTERMLAVSEDAIRHAMRAYHQDTHNLAEGAGAAPLAALLGEAEAMRGQRVGLILSGGNVDLQQYRELTATALHS